MNHIYRGRERLIYNRIQWVKKTTSPVELPKFFLLFKLLLMLFCLFILYWFIILLFGLCQRTTHVVFYWPFRLFYFLLDFSYSFLSIFFYLFILEKRNFRNLMRKKKLKILVLLYIVRVTTNLSMEEYYHFFFLLKRSTITIYKYWNICWFIACNIVI